MRSDLDHVCVANSCLYARDNDPSLYCFSSGSCVNKLSQLHRLGPQQLLKMTAEQLMTRQEQLQYERVRVRRQASESCCPVKTVMGRAEDTLAGVYILKVKQPRKENHCTDSCVYIKVRHHHYVHLTTTVCVQAGDLNRTEFCFSSSGDANMRSACHSSLPSLGNLMNFSTELFTEHESPVLLHPTLVDIPVMIPPSDPVVKLAKIENKTSFKEERRQENSPVKLITVSYTHLTLPTKA